MRKIIRLAILPFFFLAFLYPSLYAQDVIVMKDGSKLEAKIIAVETESIRYKKHNNPEGPDYVLSKSEVSAIKYANGSEDKFSEQEDRTSANTGKRTDFGHFMIGVNSIDLIFSRVSFDMEYIFAKGHLGFHPHVGFGLAHTTIIPELKNRMGLELRVYPEGQKKTSLFIGPGFVHWQARRNDFWQNVNRNPFQTYSAYYLMQGVLVNFQEHINMAFGFGFGRRIYTPGIGINHIKVDATLIFRF